MRILKFDSRATASVAAFAVRPISVCVFTALVCSGCIFNSREVTVSSVDSPSARREYFRNELTSHDGLALESENFLRGNLLQGVLRRDPVEVLNRLNAYFEVSSDPKYLLIAADICRYLATQVDEEEAIQYHLSSFYYISSFTRHQRQNGHPDDLQAKSDGAFAYDVTTGRCSQNYNEACCGIFSYLNKRNILGATSVTLHDKEGRKFVLQKPEYQLSMPIEAIEGFSLCASYEVKNLRQINREPGVGVPLVGAVKEKKWHDSLKTPKGLTIPVMFFINREDKEPGDIPLRLVFLDTYKCEELERTIGDSTKVRAHMALDFSTPLACFLNNLTERNLLSQMLNPMDQESTEGLYMVDPYQPNKIPVVFIHGLMSSPDTWVQMINSLKNDPTIRKRYQFWFFSYSTGAPVILSAKKLRTALLNAEKEFCTTPEATTNFNKMVLVGHSMGGLLTRLMVQKDPHYLIENLFQTPWDQIKSKLKPEDFELLDSYTPYPLPFVHRAVFMAVPHKGASMAQSPLGRLGSYLIKLPLSLLGDESGILRIKKALMPNRPDEKFDSGSNFYTGIDNLDPDNRFVLANGKSQLKDDLVFHSIIGNIHLAGAPDASDGIVPYLSSHLDNAASELIVKSDHSVHRRPEATLELMRILLLHLKAE